MKRNENDNVERKIRSLISDYEPDYKEEHWKKMEQKLDSSISNTKKKRVYTYLKYAATITILIGLSFYFYISNSVEMIKKTSENEKMEIKLVDGSDVWLNRTTRFIYPDKFKRNIRNVFLEGEAYFEVIVDTLKPFIINTPHAEITVLGTKFNIQANTAEDIEVVSVVEGSVLVALKSNKQKLVVESGERAIFNKANPYLKKGIIDDPNFLSWQTNKIQFFNTSLDKVAKTLSKYYNKEIQLYSEDLMETKLTSTIDNQPFDKALEVLKVTLNIEVEERNDTSYLKNN